MFRQSPLFHFRHGDHTCVFYRSPDTLSEVLTPYIAEGILKGERCFLAQKPETLKRLIYDLRFLGIDTDKQIKRGALELHTEEETYFPTMKGFEPSIMMEMLTNSIAEAASQGFSGLRTAGEMSWSARGLNLCDQILEYEKMVDECFPGQRVIGLCQYPMDEFPAEILESVLEHHRLHLTDTSSSCLYSSLHVRYGSYSAEVVADKFMVDPRYYYVVQQQSPREVVGWGVAPTFDSASARAEQLVRNPGGSTSPTAAV